VLGTVANALLWSLGILFGAGLVCVAYGVLIERRWYRGMRYRLEVARPGLSAPLSILHLSDLHFLAGDRRKARFLASLSRPDVTVLTGDVIGEPEGVEEAVAALRPLRGRLASYVVLGSNDYFVAEPLNYLNYFTGKRKRRPGVRSRWREMVAQLEAEGWTHLPNRRTELAVDGVRLEVIAPRRDPAALGLAVVHSPDPAPELAALGYDLILSGHTHGGQVRLPVIGAIVTNSQMPTRLCRGLSRLGSSILHISPGLGTSKFAPFRFLCRPEATILELVPAPVH
jgi:predicted MPP superfamily phosphohydrolase